ncbi:hypothetical protein SAMN05421788_104124 [Filimonas lacunae]|uniref:NACHT domain-containing protein n=1 Tax=Filimonas lacunae TaxID=477680 RepID=A0A173M9E5_9BACT|nr:hypothetical protein [Filimonas lacunae]BAV04142.1 hypothetical protein FLA_0121 [Filimonas lacunae]SIT15020.1 hypothetical protein SAMN05421788_104124 [Filimonas lacunae]
MRTFIEDEVINSLVNKVLSRFGKKSITPAECKALSNDILAQTGKTVSETTLKRLLGFARRSFDFSIYTLDTLAEYLGHPNWDVFYKSTMPAIATTTVVDNPNKWENLKNTSSKYSRYTVQAIKNSSGIPFAETLHREELTAFIKKFMLTSQSIAPIVAPAGFGKSIGLAHTALKLWLGSSPIFPNDICCFINIQQAQTVALQKHPISEWFSKDLNLLHEEITALEAIKRKEDKLVIIIEGFDERTFSADKLKLIYANIIEFINYNNATGWVKVILALRPSTWTKLVHAYFSPSFFHSRVFIDNSYPYENVIHHTLPLSPGEIRKILASHHAARQVTDSLSGDLLELLSYPRYLDIMLTMMPDKSMRPKTEEALIYKIIDTNSRHHFQFDSHAAIKSKIIDKIVSAIAEGNKEQADTDWALIKDVLTSSAYSQLIDDFFIAEQNQYGNSLPQPRSISFHNKYVEQYFISWSLMKRNNQTVNTDLVNKVYENEYLQSAKQNIIKWYILHSFFMNNGKALQEIFNSSYITGKDRLRYFEFLVELSDGTHDQNKLIQNLLVNNDFIQTFFDKGLLYEHIGSPNSKLLVVLFNLSKQATWKHCTLTLLFLNAILHLKAYRAESYLREYRQIARHYETPEVQFAQQIMEVMLDYARYEIKSDQLSHILNRFVDTIYQPLSENNSHAYLDIILAVYGMLYMDAYKELFYFTEAIQQILPQYNHEASGYVTTLLNYVHKYASVMYQSTDEIPGNEITVLLNNAEVLPEEDSLNKTLLYLLGARYYEKRKEMNWCVTYANKASNMANDHQIQLFSLMSYKILKHAYILSNQSERAEIAEVNMKKLLVTEVQEQFFTGESVVDFRI